VNAKSGLCVFLTYALAALAWTASGPLVAETPSPAADLLHRERPDMPPGTPATESGPSAPVERGPFISRQVNVTADQQNIAADAANEPSIAVDPTDPRRLVIGWRQFNTIASNFRQAGYGYSVDAGQTWQTGIIEPGIFRSDPVLNISPAGVFYYLSLRTSPGFACDLFRSLDGGQSWSARLPAFGGDKAWLTVDRTGGIAHGYLYQAWSPNAACCGNNTFTRSTNGGTSWLSPVSIPQTPIFGTLAVGPDGEVYVPGIRAPGNLGEFLIAKSLDAQFAIASPTFTTTPVNLGGAMVYSTGPNPAGLLGQVTVVCDTSAGPRRGWVYLLCSVDPPGSDPLDVNFIRSTDGGQTWSAPMRLSTDPPASNAWQWFGTMSIAPDGRLDVVWNDTRADPNGLLTRLYYRSSSDGGTTWSAETVLTPAYHPHLGWPQQNKLGDYYDMVSDNVGASLAYAATFHGEQDVYYLRIGDYDCNGNGVPDAADIAGGTATDLNGNGLPDDCDRLGDADCSGTIDAADVSTFIFRLLDPIAYDEFMLHCPPLRTDINGDGSVDGEDIEPFVGLIILP